MYPAVVTKDPTAVEVEVQATHLGMFPSADPGFVPRIFGWATDCFTGKYRDYLPVDAQYHDFEHTLQGTLCMARLLRGRHLAGAQPFLTEELMRLGLLAILLHDTGYLKKHEDIDGTGAKYTVTHVSRSAEFAEQLMAEKGFGDSEIKAVQNMIRCTGVDSKLKLIPFHSEPERMVGFALATADLLGQLAADDYVEKLPILYAEFAEAARFSKDPAHFVSSFQSVDDLMRKTPGFWGGYVRNKLENTFVGLYRFLADPYPSGPNLYLERIEANMERVRECRRQRAERD